MKSLKMWVILLAVIFSDTLAAPMTTVKPVTTLKAVTTVKPVTTLSTSTTLKPTIKPLADLVLEVQELIIFRDLFASKDSKKSNEYADKLLPKKQDLLNRKKIAAALPNFDESLYSPNPFFKEHLKGKDPLIQTYLDKIEFYKDKQIIEDSSLQNAYARGYPRRYDPDGREDFIWGQDFYYLLIKFYKDMWDKRNLTWSNNEYHLLTDYWQTLLNERRDLDKMRGPSKEDLAAYLDYLNGPTPQGGYTTPFWPTEPPPKKWVYAQYPCGYQKKNTCNQWMWQ